MIRPHQIGIKAIEIYFPSQYVDQEELEQFDGVSKGKYTIGLGQTKMSFCDDREDIYSMALTAVSSLLSKYDIEPQSIGRLEVGTETLLDKSKSVKSVLMQLFQHCNTNIEGVDTVNACYGGTNALFNALNWVESSNWDGRDAIVVAGDIALYSKGNARPTGGAGCVAMLVGPGAPLVFDPGLRGSYMRHAYDFYKPDLTSEYPYVDGQLSLKCYTEALDACYGAYLRSAEASQNGSTNGTSKSEDNQNHSAENECSSAADRFDFVCFHAPTCKIVAKSYSRLFYNDFMSDPNNPLFRNVPSKFKAIDYDASLVDKSLEKTFLEFSKDKFARRVQPATFLPTNCGNMYCASLFSGLCGVLSLVDSNELQNKRVGLFSYGSGLASSFFSMKIVSSTEPMKSKLDLERRLEARRAVPPSVYDEMCSLREHAHLRKSYEPMGNIDTLAKGTYYLSSVDDMYRRVYAIKK